MNPPENLSGFSSVVPLPEPGKPSELDGVTSYRQTATRRQIRGSSLLLAGVFVSRAVNFATQIIIVRYLSQEGYGAFAYALSIVAIFDSLALFGLDRAITRFVPIYHEHGEHNKLFGTLIMVIGTILSLSILIIGVFYGFQHLILQSFIKDNLSMGILMIMIFMIPFDALDELLIGLFAVFSKPSAIFFRKNVLAPGLKLGVVLLLVLVKSNVYFLTAGFLIAGASGLVIYSFLLFRILRDQGLFSHFNIKSINMPWREVFSFTIPLLTSELVYVVMNSMDAVLLARFKTTVDIASFRAVQPTAMLNQMVMTSFATLFTPLAARLFARKDREGINNLYWQTGTWIAVISFPIFALTFSLSKPITILLYGNRYENSAIILSLLSLGYYFNAATGFNGLTLKVYGKLKYIVILNVATAIANLAINLLLIPRYGALGAAVGTTTTLLIHNILKQTGLRMGTGINVFDWRYLRTYIIIILASAGLLVTERLFHLSVYFEIALAGLVSLLVLWLNRHKLDVHQTFPELLRFPIVRLFFSK
jgi:O-antigen/teichoic acid export membrane protein